MIGLRAAAQVAKDTRDRTLCIVHTQSRNPDHSSGRHNQVMAGGPSQKDMLARAADVIKGAAHTVTGHKDPPAAPSLAGKTAIITGGNAGVTLCPLYKTHKLLHKALLCTKPFSVIARLSSLACCTGMCAGALQKDCVSA